MKRDDSIPEDFPMLADAAIEGTLTPAQAARLEELIATNPAACRWYADHAALHASLAYTTARRANIIAPAIAPRRPPSHRMAWFFAGATGFAALLAFGMLYLSGETRIATLTETKACRWDGGTLPTAAGSGLVAGRLRLSEGLAKLVFASGAELTLEGPVDLELVSEMKCILRAGQLSAKVPPSAHGFIVETPSSVLTDLGTEFGVKVHDTATADVQVFSGRVDVKHRLTGGVSAMTTGKSLRFSADRVRDFNPEPATAKIGAGEPRRAAVNRVVQLTTAMAGGRDAYVIPQDKVPAESSSDTLLLVKRTTDSQKAWTRMAYIGMDLSPLKELEVQEAEISFAFAPTDIGFASQVPDCSFSLYGLLDDGRDAWTEEGITWKNAPANRGDKGLDPAKARRLGSFIVPQGQQSGTFRVAGPELAEFVRADKNRYATFILLRDTPGSGARDLVHGIASRRHPTLPPPTLRITSVEQR